MSKGQIVITMPMEQLADFIETAMIKAHNQQLRPPPEKLYTFAEAARLMGKCYNTVCNMVASDRIRATADGKYISQRAIDNYLDGQK